MSKYDFELDLSMNSSVGMILSKLKPNTVILEFGCATGRMTRYMKEALNCQVYIVENDPGAFEKAKEFACDGICDDIQNYRWLERFGDLTFDAILFADVLEHLQDPEDVLKKAAGLLKEDGSIFVSVPNVTHNDVVLKAIEERFDYTQTGLLDNTHIHFWGMENIKTLGKAAGLTVRKLEGTCCPTGSTEQNPQTGKNPLLENILRERPAGEIYQFVLTMDKRGAAEPGCTIGAPAVTSHIYLDTGNDFNAQEQIAVNAVSSGNGSYTVHYELTDAESVCRVRLDPVEGQGVIMRRICICQNGRELTPIMPNAIRVDSGVYIHSDDPMVIAQLQPGEGIVTVDAEFVLPGAQYLDVLENTAWEKQQQIRSLEERLNKCIEEKEQQRFQLEQQSKQLEADVRAYMLLTNQKEKLALSLKQQADADAARIRELEAVVAHYQNLKVIRIRAWIGRVLRKIKRCAKKLLRRG